ncbi:MAG: arylsulfatase [Bacteroidales bacterium]|nr:arylsulfatase [Bacteroidales bacterium]
MRKQTKTSLKITILLAAFTFLAISCSDSKNKDQKDITKPNIVFIMADDLGYGELGCYGQEKIHTPNIDALAKQGMKFTQFYTGAPVCAPARSVLLTGKHMGHSIVRGNNEWASRGDVWDYAKASADPKLEGQWPLPAETVTFSKILQKAGYKTAVVGKWGLGAPFTDGVPSKQGFDFFYGYNCQRQAHSYYPLHLWKNDEKVAMDNELVVPGTKLDEGADPYDINSYKKFTQKEYAADLMMDATLEFLETAKDQPFLLYFASPIPHNPLQAPAAYVEKYHKEFGEEEPYLGDRGYFPARYPLASYAAMITYLDDQVGSIISKLKEMGVYDNTIIFFTSDNGPTYSGGVDGKFFNSAGPFNSEYGWGKGFTHEGGIREPMIASWPGHIEPGTVSDHIGSFQDMLPTFCDLGGIETPETDGISILPTLTKKGTQKEHAYLYWEFPSYTGQQAVRMGKWKAIRQNIFKGNMDIELYDLEKDIKEENNVASENPEIVKQMEDIMIKEHVPSEMFPLFPAEREKKQDKEKK